MEINIKLTSKELGEFKKKNASITYNWNIDITTEANEISKEEELSVFMTLLWGLLIMLPQKSIKYLIEAYNNEVNKVLDKIEDEAKDKPIVNFLKQD